MERVSFSFRVDDDDGGGGVCGERTTLDEPFGINNTNTILLA